jgi:adenosine deaminase
MTSQIADLHLHFQGCIRPKDLLEHLATAKNIDWEWYEETYRTAYGKDSPVRQLVEKYRSGDKTVIEEFEKLAIFSHGDAGEFSRFLAKSNLFWAGAYRNDDQTDNVRELLSFASEIKDDFIEQGISYAEFRQSAVEPALLKKFCEEEGRLTMRFAASLDRNDPWGRWEQVKEQVLDEYGKSLTAIDFCGVEEGYPPKDMARFFESVKEFNQSHPERALAILYHVGESFADKSLESAIRWVQEAAEMGAHRLGHAIALGVDPTMFGEHVRREHVSERIDQINYDLRHEVGLEKYGVHIQCDGLVAEQQMLAELPKDTLLEINYDSKRIDEIRHRQGYAIECVKATGAVIEVCPTSNMRIAGITNPAFHPIHRFVAECLPIVISTDDPGMFGITLEDELDWVSQTVEGGSELRNKLITNAHNFRSEVLTGRIKLT